MTTMSLPSLADVIHSLGEGRERIVEHRGFKIFSVAMADNAAEVFVYTGEGAVVPNDVVRVRIDPSVLVIP